jgi:7-cyano-7-deazaguanine synthase in queuosine biosynthesis
MSEFKILDGNLGISISGGTDSSLVLYLLMKNYKGHIKVFTTYWKDRPIHLEVVNNVFQKCRELTGHRNSELIITTIDEKYSEHNLFDTPLCYLKRGLVDYVYTGLTSNPPVELKYSEKKINTRDKKRENLIDETNFYLPFANENKKYIAEMYKQYDLMETLFPITFSCIMSKSQQHCDSCWWCEERKWAFERLI